MCERSLQSAADVGTRRAWKQGWARGSWARGGNKPAPVRVEAFSHFLGQYLEAAGFADPALEAISVGTLEIPLTHPPRLRPVAPGDSQLVLLPDGVRRVRARWDSQYQHAGACSVGTLQRL